MKLRSMGATGIVALMLYATRKSVIILLPAILLSLVAPGCRRAPEPAPVPEAAAAPAAETPRVSLTATVEPVAVAPGGAVTVAWRLAATPGWHFYWDGRNDSGFAPRQKLFLPDGWTAGPLQWPTPERLVSPGDILDHVYHDEVVMLQEITAPRDAAAAGRRELRADWQWLTCKDSCVPGRDSLAVAVTVDPTAAAAPAAPSPALAAVRARLPQPLPAGLVTTTWDGGVLRIARTAGTPGGRLTFMPAVDCAELADLLNDGQGQALALHLSSPAAGNDPVRGLLLVEDPGAAPRAFHIDVPGNNTEPHATGG